VAAPFVQAGHDISNIFYFGESVLRRDYRGQGVGVKFFEARERQAAGFEMTAFCAVKRAENHPLRPAGYQPLDAFWGKRGYAQRPELVCKMSWRELGQQAETMQELTFWTKVLQA
jgi:GNAT superfamily N-acetyltransferase